MDVCIGLEFIHTYLSFDGSTVSSIAESGELTGVDEHIYVLRMSMRHPLALDRSHEQVVVMDEAVVQVPKGHKDHPLFGSVLFSLEERS